MDIDLTFRHDRIKDKQNEQEINIGSWMYQEYLNHIIFDTHEWKETIFKISSHLSGNRGDLSFNTYINFGTNVKFPTLFQQISTPYNSAPSALRPNLNPEKNHSIDVGVEFTKDVSTHPVIYGWHFSGYLFQNYYDNKFRSFYTPGIPIAFYDNVPDAYMKGLESKSGMFFLKKKLTLELGLSRYFISNKAVFPFKYDFKSTFDLKIDHAGFAVQIHLFREGDQIGLIRKYSGGVEEIELPSQTNLDFHISKKIQLGKVKLTGNVSGRNLLNNELELEGYALRDRRFYLTFGIQY
jgi:outer membrane receptor protein involved in Fe transport